MVVGVEELLGHVLRNGEFYPGPHNQGQKRTTPALAPLDPSRQLRLIFDGFVSRLEELLRAGQSVTVPTLGIFTFECTPAGRRGNEWDRKPVFVPSPELLECCTRYHDKEQVRVDNNSVTLGGSVPAKITCMNEITVAQGAYLHVGVVKSGLSHTFKAVVDLIARGYDLELEFGSFLKLQFFDKKIAYKFMNFAVVEKENAFVSDTWRKSQRSQAMSTFIEKPTTNDVDDARIATNNLGVMSKDLNSVKTS